MVNVMMAIEEKFGIHFPDKLLNRRSFASMAVLARIISDLQAERGR